MFYSWGLKNNTILTVEVVVLSFVDTLDCSTRSKTCHFNPNKLVGMCVCECQTRNKKGEENEDKSNNM